MLSWQVIRLGRPGDALELREVPEPKVPENGVLVQVEAAGVNFPDLLMCGGEYQERPQIPFTPGLELAGRVVAAPERYGEMLGERVAGLTSMPSGAFSEVVPISVADVLRIPESMDFEVAAAMPITYHTAHVALHRRAGLKSGETLLVHGGAGGVGSAAIQIGRAAGAFVIATATGVVRARACSELGANLALDLDRADVVEAVKDATAGRGADVVFDPVGGELFRLSQKCIAFEGRILTIGFSSGEIPNAAANHVLLKNYSLVGLHWGLYRKVAPEVVASTQTLLGELFTRGLIKPHIGASFEFSRVPEAIGVLESRSVVGKVVVGRS
ncbi:MAG: NADPH:quinone oxidoreductase family protein [Actinomycetota bacterium]|nr:NADPH:quinone oxidoreductase family protein [Actinomycetota bacterium]